MARAAAEAPKPSRWMVAKLSTAVTLCSMTPPIRPGRGRREKGKKGVKGGEGEGEDIGSRSSEREKE